MIQIVVKKFVGKNQYEFVFSGESLFDAVMKSQHVSFDDIEACGLCSSDSLTLRAYRTEKEGYEYVKIQCRRCKAQLTFGKTKKEGAFFLRRDDDGHYAWMPFVEQGQADAEGK
jgi:hypothetical protein